MVDLLLIGAEKAGTTWLHGVLQDHPDIFFPRVKEIHYFNKYDSNLREIDNFSNQSWYWYTNHFGDAIEGQIVGEATPLYISDPEAPSRIKNKLPNARFIVVLRNPVERAISHYRMARAKNHIQASLKTLIQSEDQRILQRGLYGRQLRIWFKLFDRSRFFVIFHDDIVNTPSTVLTRLAEWLSISVDPLLKSAPKSPRNQATEYHFPTLYNASVRGARCLRNIPLTRELANRLKASGLYEALKRVNRKTPTSFAVLESDLLALKRYYFHDVTELRRILAPTVVPWQNLAVGGA